MAGSQKASQALARKWRQSPHILSFGQAFEDARSFVQKYKLQCQLPKWIDAE